MFAFLKRLLGGHQPAPPTAEELAARRQACSLKFHHFKLLLAANGKALEAMAEIEKALAGGRVYGMGFVRSQCTAAGVNVFSIIRHLDQLAPGTYARLFERFADIRARLDAVLAPAQASGEAPLVLPLARAGVESADLAGSKMAVLGEIGRTLRLPIPPGFVVTTAGFTAFMAENGLKEEVDRLLQAAELEGMDDRFRLASAISQRIMAAPLPPALEQAMARALENLRAEAGEGLRLSVRSSALGEDAPGASFAGQFRSLLNVAPESLADSYREVVASMYSLPALNYRLARGLRDEDAAMAVGCMAMVRGRAGGVAYSRNPVHIRDGTVLISAVLGLPKAVVEGGAPADLYLVARGEPMRVAERRIARKDTMFLCRDDEGVCALSPPPDMQDLPALSDAEALALADMAAILEEYYGGPQDIEWVLSGDGRICLLQCRPLRLEENLRERFADLAAPAPGQSLLSGGRPASPGVCCGRVRKVQSDADALGFTPGDILVVSQSLPKWAALLPYASGLVAERGGVTGHLASVAREFRAPALVGLEGALSRLDNGAMVTLDADAGQVYQGCVESLLQFAAKRPAFMEGSPVRRVLEEAGRLITPLTLLDPDAPDFRARNCATYHDLARYSHEKAVQEMFDLSLDRDVSAAAGKRLKAEVATQFWVVDLEDGFLREPEGLWIDMEDIACLPMRALWEGIVAIPWQGPPPVDGKGLMSIMAQAASNPNLDPSREGTYANRNYFIISKNFVNLQSRFGFHFLTVEAMVSERAPQNYVLFRFQGGAADLARRKLRTAFIGEILSGMDFQVRVSEDILSARLEGYDQEEMRRRLRVIGYLTQHTRQVDMVMKDPAATQRIREKILSDIASLNPA